MKRFHIPPRLFAMLVLIVASPRPADAVPLARSPITGEDWLIARCIRQASVGRPWLEKTLWGLRDQEGGWLGAQIGNSDGSQDLGPLQINSQWVPKLAAMIGRPEALVRYWLVHDPCFNVEAGRWLFLSALRVTRDYWTAIGVYHSPTLWRQKRYATAVAAHIERRFGPEMFR